MTISSILKSFIIFYEDNFSLKIKTAFVWLINQMKNIRRRYFSENSFCSSKGNLCQIGKCTLLLKNNLAILDILQWKGNMTGNTSPSQAIRKKKLSPLYKCYFVSEHLLMLLEDSPNNTSTQIIKTSSELRLLKTEV